MIQINDAEFSVMRQYLSRICGIEVPPEKKYLFITRLAGFLKEEKCSSFSDFYTRLSVAGDKNLENQLIQAMTTHESAFFRDGHPFEVLQRKLLPAAVERRLTAERRGPVRLRILSCGCSIGQEPYTLAMCVREVINSRQHFKRAEVTILGIDLSDRALKRAKHGAYTDMEVGRFIPEPLKTRYLIESKDGWRVQDPIRSMVNFAQVNLAENFAFIGQFDIILCRNVIIYLLPDLKRRILEQFRNLLNPGGVLILGASESLYSLSDEFTTVHEGPTTYYVPKEKMRDFGTSTPTRPITIG